jgi:hypothetical protein
VWCEVTQNILENNEDAALAAKSALENNQRLHAKKNIAWEPQLFQLNGDFWEYKGLT